MTDYAAVLRELLLAGYEGAHLQAAFERMCAAIGAGNLQIVQSAPAKGSKPAGQAETVVLKADKTVAMQSDTAKATNAAAPAFAVLPPPDNAKAIAQKALGTSQMPKRAVRVGFALLDHFNLKSGRCDPGLASLARRLAMNVRTVERGVSDLVGAGLFAKVRHGGRGHANAYQVNWALMAERATASEQKPTATKLSFNSDKTVAQNLLKKPDSDSMLGKPQRGRAPPADTRQGFLIMPIAGGRSGQSHRAQAIEAVRTKLWQQLQAHLAPLPKAEYVAALTQAGQIDRMTAIEAEMQRAGDGLPILLAALDAMPHGRKAAG